MLAKSLRLGYVEYPECTAEAQYIHPLNDGGGTRAHVALKPGFTQRLALLLDTKTQWHVPNNFSRKHDEILRRRLASRHK